MAKFKKWALSCLMEKVFTEFDLAVDFALWTYTQTQILNDEGIPLTLCEAC